MTPEQAIELLAAVTSEFAADLRVPLTTQNGQQVIGTATSRILRQTVDSALSVLSEAIKGEAKPCSS